MKNILISTMRQDVHSIAVAVALQIAGHNPILWYTKEFVASQTHSVAINENEGAVWDANGKELEVSGGSVDSVWFRRPVRPYIPDIFDPQDSQIAKREISISFGALISSIAEGAFWVNNPSAAKRADFKPVQLIEARRSGLRIPETLFTNDPVKIRTFIDLNRKHSGTIYKTQVPAYWKNDCICFTNFVDFETLPADNLLRAVPGIFQAYIPKNFEIRVTCFGPHVVAAKILSQDHPQGIVDWRAIPAKEVVVEPYELPANIANSCSSLLKQLGIVFGCIDLICTPEGEYVFLEVNEQGQFLWLENDCPELKMLDAFVQLISGNIYHQNQTRKTDTFCLIDVLNSSEFKNMCEMQWNEIIPESGVADKKPVQEDEGHAK